MNKFKVSQKVRHGSCAYVIIGFAPGQKAIVKTGSITREIDINKLTAI